MFWYSSDGPYFTQKMIEAQIVQMLIDRLDVVSPIANKLRHAIHSFPKDVSRVKREIAVNCLYWHFLELQLIRWDLRCITKCTASTWISLFVDCELGWQSFWRGDRSILDVIEVFVNARMNGEAEPDTEEEENDTDEMDHCENSMTE